MGPDATGSRPLGYPSGARVSRPGLSGASASPGSNGFASNEAGSPDFVGTALRRAWANSQGRIGDPPLDSPRVSGNPPDREYRPYVYGASAKRLRPYVPAGLI